MCKCRQHILTSLMESLWLANSVMTELLLVSSSSDGQTHAFACLLRRLQDTQMCLMLSRLDEERFGIHLCLNRQQRCCTLIAQSFVWLLKPDRMRDL